MKRRIFEAQFQHAVCQQKLTFDHLSEGEVY